MTQEQCDKCKAVELFNCDCFSIDEEYDKEPICKMSIYEESIREDVNVCGLALNVVCEGKSRDSNNCPFWKRGDGET
jgi:hypothetical protein